MTSEEIEEYIEHIKKNVNDDEVQHCLEDELRAGFIEYVASLGGELGEKAKLVLSTNELDFARWCA
jgi:hypothetical protein